MPVRMFDLNTFHVGSASAKFSTLCAFLYSVSACSQSAKYKSIAFARDDSVSIANVASAYTCLAAAARLSAKRRSSSWMLSAPS